jgi:hypothetical protein
VTERATGLITIDQSDVMSSEIEISESLSGRTASVGIVPRAVARMGWRRLLKVKIAFPRCQSGYLAGRIVISIA